MQFFTALVKKLFYFVE